MPDQADDVQRALAEAGFRPLDLPSDLHAVQRRVGASTLIIRTTSGQPLTGWAQQVRVVVCSADRPPAAIEMPNLPEALHFADTLHDLIGEDRPGAAEAA